jgi:hypothetical protein
MERVQEVPVEEGANARAFGSTVAIARTAGRRGLAVETFESEDEQGNPVVTVAKQDEAPAQPKSQPVGEAKKRGRARKQDLTADDVDASLQDIATGGG